MKIKVIEPSDYQQIEEIGKLSLPIYYHYFDLVQQEYSSKYLRFKVVDDQSDKILGFAIAEKQEHGSRIHLMSIAVRPDYRRLGVGQRLINRLKQEICLSLTLYVSEENHNGIRFYLKMGFIPAKRLENYYHSLNQSAYLLVFNQL